MFLAWEEKENMARRNRIIMVKRDVPKIVTPPNSKTVARYKRTNRAHLPANIYLARPNKQRAGPKGKEDVCELLQFLPLSKGKEWEIFFILQKK